MPNEERLNEIDNLYKENDKYRGELSFISLKYDFAQIEMRLGAWFVGDQGLLQEFHGEGKVYEYTYASTYGIEKSAVTKETSTTKTR